VPFGSRRLTGVIVGVSRHTRVPTARLKSIEAVLDASPLLPPDLLELLRWAWTYYHHAPGEVLSTALPALLRRGSPPERAAPRGWILTPAGRGADSQALARAPRQRAVLEFLLKHDAPVAVETLEQTLDNWRGGLAGLDRRGWVARVEMNRSAGGPGENALPLNPEQQRAVEAITGIVGAFGGFLVHGVTGSGKTEVYLQAIAQVLERQGQALIIVPEIGLTPQLCERFEARFPGHTGVLHSALTDRERLDAWCAARDGDLSVLIGTRSAVFTPLARPGVFIVDEEHDLSLKQQDGFRYSARDLAVMRARLSDVPVVLGSATPSLESLNNAERGRYTLLRLPTRATGHPAPTPQILDVRARPMSEGLSDTLINAVRRHLRERGQVLLFLNRRGFAPVLICHECGWTADCPRCDAHMTLHAAVEKLRCHHCGTEQPVPAECPGCRGREFLHMGHGTERLEGFLQKVFSDTPVLRVDRDTTRRKGRLEELLAQARAGDPAILVGTQMLAKGHDFPNITLAGIVDMDQGLFSTDFRGPERVAQLITQVAGRAGRGERAGEVLLQTHQPDHPLLQTLLADGYASFADAALAERKAAGFPPYAFLALLRAEAPQRAAGEGFMAEAAGTAGEWLTEGVQLLGPVPAPMERRAGRFRIQLLVHSARREALHTFLEPWAAKLETLDSARRVRWSLDVDPVDMY
jgi:primosomal protein N' (replication factor Y)